MNPEWSALRARVPIFGERVYLASHCLGPLPAETFRDLDEYAQTLRLRNRALEAWMERISEVRSLCEQVLHGAPGTVALGASSTQCHAQIASALRPRGERRVILGTDLDFPSVRYLWAAQAARGFEYRTVCSPDGVAMPTQQLIDAIDEHTAVVAVSVASYFNGAMLDLAPVIAAAHAHGACVVLDAFQAVGIVPLDVGALGVDFLVAGTHKWLCGGGTGLAFVYVRPDRAIELTPAYPGWLGHTAMADYAESYVPAVGARRFEQGTPAVEPVYTARAGLRLVLDAGVEALRARNLELSDRMLRGAEALGIAVDTPREHHARSGMLCLRVVDAKAVAGQLEARGFDVDTRPGSGLRASPHPLLTEDECDAFLHTLASLIQGSSRESSSP